MPKEKFNCPSCEGEGTITFKQNDSKFKYEVIVCPLCGADLEDEVEEVEEE